MRKSVIHQEKLNLKLFAVRRKYKQGIMLQKCNRLYHKLTIKLPDGERTQRVPRTNHRHNLPCVVII